MKKGILLVILTLGFMSHVVFAARPTAVLGPGTGSPNFRVPYHETSNRMLSRDTTYILSGWYFIDSTYSITIPAGTLIRGDSASGGTIIVKRGAQIHAAGTKECPIIFTSNKPAGTRLPGDWGGVILQGNAPINFSGPIQAEGGFGTIPNTDALYGGPDPDDNSGELEYVRIEYAGIAFAQDNEVNGLTLCGVGRGTHLDHIQVSYANDDDIEMFGGTVDVKYYVGWIMVDDNIDTDQGYAGRIQFAYEKRDPNIFDASAAGSSEGFESDGETPQSPPNPGQFLHYPHTSARVSNITVVGPQPDTNTAVNGKWTVVARLRRATQWSIYNSILMGYPQGINIRDTMTERCAQNDSLEISHTSLQSKTKQIFEDSSPNTGDIAGFNVLAWFTDPSKKNIGSSARQPNDVGLPPAVFNLDLTNNPVPPAGSEADTAGTSYQGRLAGDSFFDSVSYRGAFDPSRPRNQQWDWGWTNYDPQNYDPEATLSDVAYDFADSWNLVSLPFREVTNSSAAALFPTSKPGSGFKYSGSYIPVSNFVHGEGYWLQFTGAQSTNVIGCTALIDTMPVVGGWSLIGSVADTVPVGSVTPVGTTISSSFFTYNGSYSVAANIEPGKAYWVKTAGAGSLIVDGFSTPKPKQTPTDRIGKEATTVTFRDNAGHAQSLYLTLKSENSPNPSLFEMPPLPPSGGFDVRFSSGRMAEIISGSSEKFSVEIHGGAYPLSLSLASGHIHMNIQLLELENGRLIKEYDLSHGGALITDAPSRQLVLRVSGESSAPTNFALHQNYPNPFNPSTRFDIDIPQATDAHVTIYNVYGQQVKEIFSGELSAGVHTLEWDGKNDQNAVVPTGTYFLRMQSESFRAVQKLLFMK